MTPLLNRKSLTLAGVLLGCSLGLGSFSLFGNVPAKAQTAADAEAAITMMVRGQGTYRKKHRRFTANVATLKRAFGIPTVPGYNVAIRTTRNGAFHHYVPRDPSLTAFVGATFLEATPGNRTETVLIVCEAQDARSVRAAEPSYVRGFMKCAYNTTERFKVTAEERGL